MNQTQGVRRVSYKRHWFLFLLIVAGAGWYFYKNSDGAVLDQPVYSPVQPIQDVTGDKKWFFVIRMPEVTQGFPPRAAQKKLEGWLSTLRKHDFHIMRLSDVVNRLHDKETLPEKTLVLCFDPGYRQTYDVLSPILARHGIPAVWMTGKKELGRADTRFLSKHQLRKMEKSRLWDVGIKDAAGRFSFKRLGRKWRFEADNFALNNDNDLSFRRLNANPNWTEEELIQRLNVELPAEEPVYLTTVQIQDRTWGLTVPAEQKNPPSFDLVASPQKRWDEVHWLGTVGHENFEINLKTLQVDGELWVQFPFDILSSKNVGFGITTESITVIEQQGELQRVLAIVPWSELPESLVVNAKLTLQNNKITAQINNEPPFTVEPTSKRQRLKGGVQLLVYDKVRGVAQAKSVQMTLNPITNPSAS